jgi:choline dehydrogenase-like flavoprotein
LTWFDVVIIGSGPGGGTLAHALSEKLAGTRTRILLLERGEHLPREAENWSPSEVFVRARYARRDDRWTLNGAPSAPHGVHWVGGMTKFYGGALLRLREHDFAPQRYPGGTTAGWPLTYADLEPYYARAEALYGVAGLAGADPTEPPRSGPFPRPPLAHDPHTEEVLARFRGQGLRPFAVPTGIDAAQCVRCSTCDGFPCRIDAKCDTELRCIQPAVARGGVELWTGARATRLHTDPDGRRVTEVEVERGGELLRIAAGTVVLSAGVIQSPILLLQSRSAAHPRGLANGSDQVGRHLLSKCATRLAAVHDREPHPALFMKTWGLHDYYLPDARGVRRGTLQSMGRFHDEVLTTSPVGVAPGSPEAARTLPILAWTECLPDPDNRVQLADDGTVRLSFRENNLDVHQELIEAARDLLATCGYGQVGQGQRRLVAPSSSGTLRCGHDPATSVLDVNCRAHEVDNLYGVDACFFPGTGCVNPALTIMANALRVADHLVARGLG